MTNSFFDLTGKVAVVTGGNSGIGLGMVEALARAGAAVSIWGSSKEKNAAALQNLATPGFRVIAVACDITDEHAVENAFAETLGKLGGVDACFANAGVYASSTVRSFASMTTEEWRRVMRVDLEGAFFTLRAAASHMIERGEGGSLVVTSSLAAISGPPRAEHYAAAKGGLISMIQGLAVELGRHRIRANAILPGWVATPMTQNLLGGERFADRVLSRVPLRRWGTPQDFGGIAVYLASDASAYHTGDTILIDGGYSKF
jgi:NAD(P)-dependent dehydrogenase (short-subunit alcohol dehydrogenase family)